MIKWWHFRFIAVWRKQQCNIKSLLNSPGSFLCWRRWLSFSSHKKSYTDYLYYDRLRHNLSEFRSYFAKQYTISGTYSISQEICTRFLLCCAYTSCEFIMNDCITTTKQSTTKPCTHFLGYTVTILMPINRLRSSNFTCSCAYTYWYPAFKDVVATWQV